ncbi:hypothetical protein VTL71DRAFT_68 [Oculimacula yallundae]|uniref:Protein kinase domain-containing protein n=1 Tax=Oculimacula yallundae TaxID=86028 RepID=A0ABR4D046_9HELO
MAEAIGLALGTTGLISVAQMCIKVAQVVKGMKQFREETTTLFATYEFEYVRLNLWVTQVLGVSVSYDDLKDLNLADAELPSMLSGDAQIDLRAPLHNALNEVKRILVSLVGLLEKYRATEVSVPRRAGFKTKIYKDGGQEAIESLLREFKSWNDRLEGVLESRLRSILISNMQVQILAAASTPEQLHTIELASRSSHPALNNQVLFRQSLIEIESRDMTDARNLHVSAAHIEPRRAPREKNNNLREMGILTKSGSAEERILQEWKFGQPDWTANQITEAMNRASKLASMLHLDCKPENLRCLDLVGYTTVDTPLGRSDSQRIDFCFLYRIPAFADDFAEPLSLREALNTTILKSESDKPTLSEKFSIATALAKSLLAFHSSNWLHKAMCSSSVIFFRGKEGTRLLYSQPYLSGFEFARPDTARDQTLDAFGGDDFDIFCHPDLVQTIASGQSGKPRYQRQYDIYGLGMMLLEIGCWSPMSIYAKNKAKDLTNHEQFLKTAGRSLPPRVGTQYRDVVMRCLQWRPDAEKDPVGWSETDEAREDRQSQVKLFMQSVVNVLEGCHCRI